MRTVVLVAHQGVQLLDVAGPADVLDGATRLVGPDAGYRLIVAAPGGGEVRAGGGLRLCADVDLDAVRGPVDTVLVAGGWELTSAAAEPGLVDGVRRLAGTARRTTSVCTGATVLAQAGLLDGRRATTHWAFAPTLHAAHPDVRLEPDRLHVRDGDVLTSAGVSAGMDLALALVEEDHGAEVARTVARWLVLFLQRPGGQSQFSERLALPVVAGSPLRPVLDAVVADPAADHRTPAMAARAALSERQLTRRFAAELGTTPARFVERVRVEAARSMLEQDGAGVDVIAARCGLGSPETLRRAFLRVLGVGPAAYRERFSTVAAA